MSNYLKATLTDGSRVELYCASRGGTTSWYWVAQVFSGPASVGASVARDAFTSRFYYKEMP